MNKFLLVVMFLFCSMSLTSCLTPEQKQTAIAAIEEEYKAGMMTKAEYDLAIEKLEASSIDWNMLGLTGFNVLLALLGAPAVVRMQRGPATQKVGLPASKVKP